MAKTVSKPAVTLRGRHQKVLPMRQGAKRVIKAKTAQRRTCVACGKIGHTVTTCTSTAAALIRKLKEQIPKRPMRKVKPGRYTPKKRGAAKRQASKSYTRKPQPTRRKTVRRMTKGDYKGKGLISGLAPDPLVAVSRLQKAGYLKFKPHKCPGCSSKDCLTTVVHRNRVFLDALGTGVVRKWQSPQAVSSTK